MGKHLPEDRRESVSSTLLKMGLLRTPDLSSYEKAKGNLNQTDFLTRSQ